MGKSFLKKLKTNPLVKAATQVATQSVVGQIAARNPVAAMAITAVKQQQKKNKSKTNVRRVNVPGNVANVATHDSANEIKRNSQGYNIITSWTGFTTTYNYGVVSFLACPWAPFKSDFHNGIGIGINKSLLQDCLTHTHYRIKKFRLLFNSSTPSTSNTTISISGCKDPNLDVPSWDYFTTMEKSIQFSAWAPDANERFLDLTDVISREWLKIDPTVMHNSSKADKQQCCAGQVHAAILTADTAFLGSFMLQIECEFRGRNPFDTSSKVLVSYTNSTAATTNVQNDYKSLDSLPFAVQYDTINSRPKVPLKTGYQIFMITFLACQTAGTSLAYALLVKDKAGNDVNSSRLLFVTQAAASGAAGYQRVNNSGTTSGTDTALATDLVSCFALIKGAPGDYLDFYVDDDNTLTANRTVCSLTLTGITNAKALEIAQGFTPSLVALP